MNRVAVFSDGAEPCSAVSLPEEPSDHVSGAGAGEPESCAGDQEREAASAGCEADENGETGGSPSWPPPPPERTVSVKQARGSELQPWDGLSCPCRLFGNFTNGKRGFIFFSVIAQGSVIAASGNSSPLPHPHPTEQAEQHGVLGEPQQTNQAPISVVDESSPAFEEFLNNVKAVTLMYHQLWAGFVCPKQLDL